MTNKGLPQLAQPTEEAGRYSQTGCMRRSAVCHYSLQGVQKSNISIYIVKGNFSKIVAFKPTIGKFLNALEVHIEGIKYFQCAYSTHFFVSMSL
jgi:hypothetical protein